MSPSACETADEIEIWSAISSSWVGSWDARRLIAHVGDKGRVVVAAKVVHHRIAEVEHGLHSFGKRLFNQPVANETVAGEFVEPAAVVMQDRAKLGDEIIEYPGVLRDVDRLLEHA